MTQTEIVKNLRTETGRDIENDGTDQGASMNRAGRHTAASIIEALGLGQDAIEAIRAEIYAADNQIALAAWEGGSGWQEQNRKAGLNKGLALLNAL